MSRKSASKKSIRPRKKAVAGKSARQRNTVPLRVLFISSEAYPLIKTGGLADVSHALPNALAELGADLRVLLPAYREVLRKIDSHRILGWLDLGPLGEARILETRHDDFSMPVWLVDMPALFDREGNPYTDASGKDWADNPLRFTAFCRAAALLSTDALERGWRADVVHANDWQTGLVPAFLEQESDAPGRLFTIHNLAYDCQFDYAQFQALKLPHHWWSMEHAEFHNRFSLLKAGLVFSDRINTVSPTYAREIRTPEYGYGYAGILQHYGHKLSGILNGIDTRLWNPASDPLLVAHYDIGDDIAVAKRANRAALLQQMGQTINDEHLERPMIGFVGRLVYQKGVDLLLDALPQLLTLSNACFAFIGSGEALLEQRLRDLAAAHPERVFLHVGYSEQMAHLLEAGADIFAMPSRYEPCGLNQMYSLRYGTPPVARRTGGLADTVVHTTEYSLRNHSANGFLFESANLEALTAALLAALEAHAQPEIWQQLLHNGMSRDFGWHRSASEYLELYRNIPSRRKAPDV